MYRLKDVAVLFEIDVSSLRRWCRRSGIVGMPLAGDMRCVSLSDEEVLKLARDHKRIMVDVEMDKLLNRIDRLERRLNAKQCQDPV